MIRIAICDDMPDQLELMGGLVSQYTDENRLDAQIQFFSHPDELLTACEKQRFNLYLLDMVMPMVNGVELGRDIRRVDREAQIIYATTAPEFALDSFAANPFGYLVKPVIKERLFELLTLACSKIDSSKNESLAVKTKDGLQVLNRGMIECCEYSAHTVVYRLAGGDKIHSVSMRIPFGQVAAELLEDKRFLQPHAAFVVNMDRVKSMNEQGFVLRSGIVVPIAKKQFAAVRKTYLDFMFGRREG